MKEWNFEKIIQDMMNQLPEDKWIPFTAMIKVKDSHLVFGNPKAYSIEPEIPEDIKKLCEE